MWHLKNKLPTERNAVSACQRIPVSNGFPKWPKVNLLLRKSSEARPFCPCGLSPAGSVISCYLWSAKPARQEHTSSCVSRFTQSSADLEAQLSWYRSKTRPLLASLPQVPQLVTCCLQAAQVTKSFWWAEVGTIRGLNTSPRSMPSFNIGINLQNHFTFLCTVCIKWGTSV